ncbi:head decoration protein [Pseudokineococcus lusitanus]|uniref:Bacteriophage lambda head decoration protein D n=1 Tax=Pseudokineococcus lusitanus TaxID=763993 RepID=A0A3N1HTV8_9ACTN|nr:head decoration protein [Pseudokineococcus lusitanus]ROP45941.1 bacteriophage lambda head decoration protein D [Pseudokineococcus lusitanus]
MEGIAQTRTEYGSGNRRWLGDLHGLNSTEGGTLNGALFPAGTFPDGLVRSGTDLGRVTASGLLGPYDNAATDGRQTCVGHLVSDQVVTATSRNDAALLNHGAVVRTYLPTGSGHDAAAEADLPGIRYRNA